MELLWNDDQFKSEQVIKHEDSRRSFARPYGTSSDEEKYYAATHPNELVVSCGRDYDKLANVSNWVIHIFKRLP
jgi:hypothetical protein